MGKVNRGRFTVSTNNVMTASLITRVFSFGFIMMSIYIKAGDDILDANVMRVVNNYDIYGMPYGSVVKGLVFSLAGVFGMDLITGICALYGVLRRRKIMLGVNVVLSSIMLIIYCIYLVLFGIVYHKRSSLYGRLERYNFMYRSLALSPTYQSIIYPGYASSLGCTTSIDQACYNVYIDQLKGYVEAYFGMISACMVCQVVSIIAVEYTFRKLELKEKKEKISNVKFYLLCTMKYGILRSFLTFVKTSWIRSKLIFASVVLKITCLVTGIGLLGLGLTIISHEFIINSQLKDLFYKLQFFDYYLYDIIVGLAASCVTIGIVTIAVATIGLAGSWRRSKHLQLVNTVLSILLQIPRIACFILFVAFLGKVNDNLRFQLDIQQDGYYVNGVNEITVEWNTMIQKLDCCGVNAYTDTWTSTNITAFCYENANEISMYPSDSYSGSSSNFLNGGYIGRGDVRTTTCKARIHFTLRMMIGWFAAIILLQVILEIVVMLFVNKEFKIYKEEENLHESKPPLESDTRTSHNIISYIVIKVKDFVYESWTRSKANFVFWTCVSCFSLMKFGLLVVAIQIRYDKVLGNIYIKDYVFSFIDIGDYNLDRLIYYFHIVLSTFSLASIIVAVYMFVMEAIRFSKRTLHLILIIVFMSTLFTADITQIGLWGKAYRDICGNLTSGLSLHLDAYSYSHASLTNRHYVSAGWNTLFVKAECCGVSQRDQSMSTTSWYVNRRGSRIIPEYCCKNMAVLYPYRTITNTACTTPPTTDTSHTQVCDDAIQKKIDTYSITAFVFLAISVILEFMCISIAIYKICRDAKEEDTVHVRIKAVDDKVEIIKVENQTNEENIPEKESNKKDSKKKREKKKRKQSGKKSINEEQHVRPEDKEVEIEDIEKETIDVPEGVEKESEVSQTISLVNETNDSVVNVATQDDERPQSRSNSIFESENKDVSNTNQNANDFGSQTFNTSDKVSTSETQRDFNEMVTDLDLPEITNH